MTQSYTVDFYYDSYEKEYGDGFYPLVKTAELVESSMTETTIRFTLDNTGYWRQTSNDMIYGLDGDHGKILHDILQQHQTNQSSKGIRNLAGAIIYPKLK